MWYIWKMEYYCLKKGKKNPVLWDNVTESGGHCAK